MMRAMVGPRGRRPGEAAAGKRVEAPHGRPVITARISISGLIICHLASVMPDS
jgi:hypothetical protein